MNTEILEQASHAAPANAVAAITPEIADKIAAPVNVKRILVPLDFSEHSLKALRYAVSFAELFGAKLTVLHVVPPPVYSAEVATADLSWPEHFEIVEKELNGIREKMIPTDLEVDLVIRHTFTFDGILEVAREYQADLIVLTTHGRTGLKHLLMGSTAENIVRRAPCPVLIVRDLERDFVAC